MHVLYWGQGGEQFVEQLFSKLEYPSVPTLLYSDACIDELRGVLTTRRTDISLLVLAPASIEQLDALIAIESVVEGLPLILLLPSEDNAVHTLAHRLRPRFAAGLADNLENAAAVAANMIRIQRFG